MQITLDMLARFASTFLVLGAFAGVLWMCTAAVSLSFIRLRRPEDLTPIAAEKKPSKWGSRVNIVVVGVAAPITLGLSVSGLANGGGRPKGIADAALILPLIMVPFGAWMVWADYSNRTKESDEGSKDLDDAALRRLFGSEFPQRRNDLMLASAGRSSGTIYWLLAGVGAVAFVVTSEDFTKQTVHSTAAGYWPTVIALLIFMVLFAVVLFARRVASPHWLLLQAHFQDLRSFVGDSQLGSSTVDFKASRWRTPYHHKGFLLARRLERCLLGVQRRLEPHDADHVVAAYRKLAMALRRTGLRTAEDSSMVNRFETLRYASFTLLANNDLVAAADRVQRLLSDEPEPLPSKPSRWRRVATSSSAAIQQHWPMLKIVGFVVALALLLAAGELTRALDALVR